MKSIICLVSRQTMANVLPIMMFKPSRVYLLTTEEERDAAIRIRNVCTLKKIDTKIIEGIDPYDTQTVRRAMENVLEGNNVQFIVNLTGGTKLMSLAAYEVARENNLSALYCNTERKEVIHLIPSMHKEPLRVAISIEEYLMSYGYSIIDERSQESLNDFIRLFDYVQANNIFGSLAELFQKVNKSGLERPMTVHSNDRHLEFQKIHEKYIISYGKYKEEKQKLTITKSSFSSGFWLEAWVYYKLLQMGKRHIKVGVKLRSDKDLENEIDVMMLDDYVLHLFSCKTGKIMKPQMPIFELETLRTIVSGTFGKGYLVVTGAHSNELTNRALQLKVEVKDILATSGNIEL